MLLFLSAVLLTQAGAMPTRHLNNYQYPALCTFVPGCPGLSQTRNSFFRGQPRPSVPSFIGPAVNTNRYDTRFLPLSLIDTVVTGFGALLWNTFGTGSRQSPGFGTDTLQSPVYVPEQRISPHYELLVMRDNNVYIMPVTFERISYRDEVLSVVGPPSVIVQSGDRSDINRDSSTRPTSPLQFNLTDEGDKSAEVSSVELPQDAREDERMRPIDLITDHPILQEYETESESLHSVSDSTNSFSPENDNLALHSGAISNVDLNVPKEVPPEKSDEIVFVDLSQLEDQENIGKDHVEYNFEGHGKKEELTSILEVSDISAPAKS